MKLNKDSFIRLEISSVMADREYLLGLDGKESKFQFEAYLEFVARFSTVRKKRARESEELKSYEEVPSYDEAFE